MNNSLINLKNKIYLYCFLLILSTQLGCKILNIPQKEKQNFCYTDEMLKKSLKENPDLRQEIDLQNQALRNYINSNPSNLLKSRASGSSNFIIPIVIYIVHDNGVENISDQQIHSQIDRLNTEFISHGIAFCLATEQNGTLLPGTGADPGIIRISSQLTNHLISDESNLKALSTLSSSRYLRIWVVKDINNGSGIVGYARFPGTVPPVLEGIVMRYDVFGDIASCGCTNLISSNNQGKVLAHEVGHYLNLYHTFQGGCVGTSPTTCDLQGDLICDTPPVQQANSGCPSASNSCIESPDNNDLLDNHMDYTNDNCRNNFTSGQETRMVSSINLFRSTLVSSPNLVYTGVQCAGGLNAAFSASNYNPCTGQSVTFDAINQPGATYTWDFGDGSATVSGNPVTHSYTLGNVNHFVTLSVTDGTNTVSESQQVYISDCNPIASTQGHWYFGKYAAIDFSTGTAVGNNSAAVPQTIVSAESSISVSDNSGNLLFYANPNWVWNGTTHLPMNSVDLGGNSSVAQMAYAPDPDNNNQYYVFIPTAHEQWGTPAGIYKYVIVNVQNGTVTSPVPMSFPSGIHDSEAITVIPHCNGSDYWIVTHSEGGIVKRFYVHLLSNMGITNGDGTSLFPDEYPTGGNFSLRSFAAGQLKASPDGSKLAMAKVSGVGLYDFDRTTGEISNEIVLDTRPSTFYIGCSFSPNGKYVYVTYNEQVPFLRVIKAFDLVGNLHYFNNQITAQQIQIGPDKKLYFSRDSYSDHISSIPNPEDANPFYVEDAVDFSSISSNISTGHAGGLPNMIDAAPAPLLVADFSYQTTNCYQIDFSSTPCFNSYLWDFGDNSLPSTLENPTHTYATNGDFDVTLTVNGSTTVIKTISIGINSTIIGPNKICQNTGPIFNYTYPNNNSGLTFNWSAVGGTIGINGNSNVDVNWTSLPGTLTLNVTDPSSGCTSSTTINVVEGKFDLMVKDNPLTDLGAEPNQGDIWSGNIWNCSDLMNLNCSPPTQPAEYMLTGSNRLHVEIHNVGCEDYQAPSKSFLHLYWTIGRSGELWPDHWFASTSILGGYVAGDEITPVAGLDISPIVTGSSVMMFKDWNPPNPINFPLGQGQSEPMICYLARIESTDDPIINEVAGPIAPNVRENNNIATINSTLVDIDPFNLVFPSKYFILNNPLKERTSVRLIFEELKKDNSSFFDNGSIKLTTYDVKERNKPKLLNTHNLDDLKDLKKLEEIILEPGQYQIVNLTFTSTKKSRNEQVGSVYNLKIHSKYDDQKIRSTNFDLIVRVGTKSK